MQLSSIAGRMARAVAVMLAALGAAPAMSADAYPADRPLSLVVPYPAGGASDASARLFSGFIGEALGRRVVVENVGGGTGMLGARRVLQSPPDGYTFLHGSVNEVVLSPMVNAATTYKPEDFRLSQPITEATIVLLARSDLPVADVDGFVDLARGAGAGSLTYGSVGVGSLYHIMAEYLGRRIGAEFTHVPYRGGAPVLQDLIGRQIDFAILPYQHAMAGMAEQGQLKILTTFSRELPAPLASLPRITQSRQLSDFVYTIPGGYFVHKDTPAAELDALRMAVGKALERPELRERLEAEGRQVMRPMTQEASDRYAADMVLRYKVMVEELGIRPM